MLCIMPRKCWPEVKFSSKDVCYCPVYPKLLRCESDAYWRSNVTQTAAGKDRGAVDIDWWMIQHWQSTRKPIVGSSLFLHLVLIGVRIFKIVIIVVIIFILRKFLSSLCKIDLAASRPPTVPDDVSGINFLHIIIINFINWVDNKQLPQSNLNGIVRNLPTSVVWINNIS